MTTFTLHLSMLADWHIGTGTGRRGFADSLVKKDQHGLPFVPAKTITGIWRDACEVAAYALDAGTAGPWHDWTEHLFGSQPSLNTAVSAFPRGNDGNGGPRPATLSARSLHYHPQIADVLTARPRLAATVTFLKPGVAIDRASGRAKAGQLRYDEMARAGAVLTGTVQIAGFEGLDAAQQRAAATLLTVGAQLVESIGGKRRRGAGRCTLEVHGITADLHWLVANDQPPAPPVWRSTHDQTGDVAWPLPVARVGGAEPEIADLRLVLRSPVVAHDRTVGNAVRSLDYVPGWLLMPAVLHRLAGMAAPGRAGDAAAAARAGDLVVTNATMEIDGRPGRPAPLPLAGYTGRARGGGPPAIGQVKLTEHAHNVIEDTVQRPTEAVGGLYTYQAISEGTVLRAQVRVPAGLLRPAWQARLTGEWRIGRSSKDDYGRVTVKSDTGPSPSSPTHEKSSARVASSAGNAAGRRLHVWLLSDLLVTDCRLRPSSDPADVAAVLGQALGGVTLTPVTRSSGRAASTLDTRRLESWQRKWGLPRSSLIGIRGGSWLIFSIEGPGPDSSAVRQVELTGIGLRRGEGFGQVSIDDPMLNFILDSERTQNRHDLTARSSSGALDEASPADTANSADGVLRSFEEAAWRQAIAEQAESVAATDADRRRILGSGYKRVPATQFSALRMITATLGDGPDDRTRYWLDQLTASGRESSWPPDVRAHLTNLLTTPDVVWQHLGLPEDELSRSPDAAQKLRDGLWAHAVQLVVSACLTAMRRPPGEASDG